MPQVFTRLHVTNNDEIGIIPKSAPNPLQKQQIKQLTASTLKTKRHVNICQFVNPSCQLILKTRQLVHLPAQIPQIQRSETKKRDKIASAPLLCIPTFNDFSTLIVLQYFSHFS